MGDSGHSDATTIIDVTNPEVPVVFGTLPAAVPSALWQELEVYNNHVYLVQDLVGAGVQIFDLEAERVELCARPPAERDAPADLPAAEREHVHGRQREPRLGDVCSPPARTR